MTNELTYTKNGEYWIPDLTAAEQPMALSKYGRMREWFLKEHRTITYNNLLDVDNRDWSLFTIDGQPMADPPDLDAGDQSETADDSGQEEQSAIN
mgnify:FL=1